MSETLSYLLANVEVILGVFAVTAVCQFAIHYCLSALRRWWASTAPEAPVPEPDPAWDDVWEPVDPSIGEDDEDDPSDIDDPTEVWPDAEDLPNEFPDLPKEAAWGSPIDPLKHSM